MDYWKGLMKHGESMDKRIVLNERDIYHLLQLLEYTIESEAEGYQAHLDEGGKEDAHVYHHAFELYDKHFE